MTPTTRTRGRQVNLSELAGDPDLDDGRGPYALATGTGRSIRLTQLARNPFNKRVLGAHPDAITELAESMRANGQLQPCAVVTRAAFRRAFPDADADDDLGRAAFVQVTGARRYLAAQQLGWDGLEVVVKDDVASSPTRFLAATAAENIDRRDFDPVEEAEQVQLVVAAAGSGQAAAEHLHRSPGWVTQRLNLLKLVPELHTALRAGDIPLRDVRTLHTLDPSGQLAALRRFTAVNRRRNGDDTTEPEDTPTTATPPSDRPTPTARAIRRLGGTPDKIAAALKAELTPHEVDQLVHHLTGATIRSA